MAELIEKKLVGMRGMLEQVFIDPNFRPSEKWGYQQVAERQLPFIRLAGKILFDVDDVKRHVLSKRVAPVGERKGRV